MLSFLNKYPLSLHFNISWGWGPRVQPNVVTREALRFCGSADVKISSSTDFMIKTTFLVWRAQHIWRIAPLSPSCWQDKENSVYSDQLFHMACRGSVIFCCKSNMVYLGPTKRGSLVSYRYRLQTLYPVMRRPSTNPGQIEAAGVRVVTGHQMQN